MAAFGAGDVGASVGEWGVEDEGDALMFWLWLGFSSCGACT